MYTILNGVKRRRFSFVEYPGFTVDTYFGRFSSISYCIHYPYPHVKKLVQSTVVVWLKNTNYIKDTIFSYSSWRPGSPFSLVVSLLFPEEKLKL